MKKLEIRQLEQTQGGVVCFVIGFMVGGMLGALGASFACAMLFARPAY